MTKIYFTIVCLIFTLTIFAQDKENTSTVPNYSESIPYQPTVLSEKKDKQKKNKEEKEKKKETNEKHQEILNTTSLPIANSKENLFEMPIYIFDNKGLPVVDLKKEDFTLFVDEKEQEIEKVETENRPLNVILVLDVSASSSFEKENNLINFVIKTAEKLVPQNKIKIILFNERAKVICDFTNDLEVIKISTKKIEYSGGTSIYEMVRFISSYKSVQGPENSVVLFMTDGVDTTSQKTNYQQSLISSELSNITFFSYYLDSYESVKNPKITTKNSPNGQILGQILGQIITGNNNNPKQIKEEYELGKKYLNDLALLSGGGVFNYRPLEKLEQEDFDFLAKVIRPQYFLKFKVVNASNTDRRIQLKLRVNRPNLSIRTRGSRILPTAK